MTASWCIHEGAVAGFLDPERKPLQEKIMELATGSQVAPEVIKDTIRSECTS